MMPRTKTLHGCRTFVRRFATRREGATSSSSSSSSSSTPWATSSLSSRWRRVEARVFVVEGDEGSARVRARATTSVEEASTSARFTEVLLDPRNECEFPVTLPEGLRKREVELLVRTLAQSEEDAIWPRAELLVDCLEGGKSSKTFVDSWMYTEVLRCYRKRGKASKAYVLYEKALDRRPKLRLDSHFYAEAMLALSKGSRDEAAKAELVWNHLLRRSNHELLSKYALTAFLCCCAKSGDWKRALRAFHSDFFLFQSTGSAARERRKLPDVVACTALMKALKVGGQWKKGEELLQWMYDNGINPNPYTYGELFVLLGECNKWELVMSHYYELTHRGSGDPPLQQNQRVLPEPNMHVFSATMNALGQAGKYDLCQEVLEKMIESGKKPNAMVLVSLLSIYEKNHEGYRALQVFRYVQNAKCTRMNIFVYNVLLSALSKSEAADKAREVFEEILRAEGGIAPDRVSYETLIAAYAHVGDYSKANEVFKEMRTKGFVPTDYAYAGRIKAYAKNNMWRECVLILKEVEEEQGIQPSVHIYNAVLQACFVTKKWELALKLFARMEEKGIEPNRATKALLSKICHDGIESCEDKQRQAVLASAIAAAAGALAIRTGVF
ncbi:hypothetical protein A3770_14p73410 [Chloropicon primus]|uniref:Pentacotripeptide-repeat region of PRORP domain-containing protein n=1 Tax=Chloropicon primus TaxID=1764295 RepID=A0A5B8MW87_9CHLO|nr:hypothetical protein A3770_14p73410 [Chloropicon primus]|mmetsp:Transcript_5084/g.15258  ORF Transcript_5084/g.15258 Transcript_5084/m.15258 type:complete len:612 (-) Transcript_5084:412-2247(-)|eukprot:QDZ24823.1 hypothetical protein A3770_14p73410 [Chloropicon primus]